MRRKIRNIALVLATVGVTLFLGYRIGWDQAMTESLGGNKLDLGLMWQVRDILQKKYLDKDKIKDKEMVYGAISGLVSSLSDPYTVFLPPKENKASNEDLTGEFGGVGIQLGYKDKNLAVVAPLAKTPAEKAGLKAGDLILKIKDTEKKIDRDTAGISLDEAVTLIRGKVGTEVTLKMYREGKEETFDVVLKRDNIVVPSLEMEVKQEKGKNVVWVKLYKFSEQVYKDWPSLVDKIIVEKNKNPGNFGGIILDLRNNPGGFLQASVLVASDFIRDGVVVEQEDSSGQKITYRVEKGRGKLINEKLVVLINGGSASAAEILAGALRDYNRAKLVGEKSFGKGTVQSPEDFADGSGIHITVAKWLLPSGKNIHGEGVTPEVEVKAGEDLKVDLQLQKAIEELL
ncbi:MAG: S41 family peptidase, partial [Patescibacteria group bacterium]